MESTLSTNVARLMTRLAGLDASSVIVLNPGMPLAPGVTIAADASPGAPPNRYTYSGTYDGNGDGLGETTLNGRVTYANDPTDFSVGFTAAQGDAHIDADILGLLHVYRGDVTYTLGMEEHRVHGGGTFTNPMTGSTTTMTVDAGQPMGVKIADGSAGARPNACAHSLSGTAQVSVAGPAGTLASAWRFAYDRSTVTVTNATYTDKSGKSTSLPNREVDVGCGAGGSINDWSGRFRIRWACLPQEFGEFETTISVKNATTVTMVDDGDTLAESYDASVLGSSPRAIRGFFIDGTTGARYREDFNWTLNPDGNGFAQISRYVYIEGAQAGQGGICAARATRL
jgi:hypothetical protein